MAKRRQTFYDRPIHQRLAVKVVDGLISAGVVYLLSPYLIEVLAPVQAQINSGAAAAGQPVSNVGTSKVANTILAAAAS
jgi:hypothetical protein